MTVTLEAYVTGTDQVLGQADFDSMDDRAVGNWMRRLARQNGLKADLLLARKVG